MTSAAAYRYRAGRVLVFARAPQAGAVKTRLAADIGAQAALEIHCELLRRTLAVALGAGLAALELHVAPDPSHPFIRSLLRDPRVKARRQQGADLGARMRHALCAALRSCDFALLIGSDCPAITAHYLDRACRALDAGMELVIGPAEDGGYVLIGARRCCAQLFESVPWGSAGVLEATRARARALRLRYSELDVLWDLDTVADLERWRSLSSNGTPQSTI